MTSQRRPTPPRRGMFWRSAAVLALAGSLLVACQSGAPAAAPTSAPAPAPTAAPAAPTSAPTPANVESQPVAGGPTLLRANIGLRKVADAGGGSIKLARSPKDGFLYILNAGQGLFRLNLDSNGGPAQVIATTDIFTDAVPAGMAFAPDGTLFVAGNRKVRSISTQAIIRKGTPGDAKGFSWTTLAATVAYPLSDTPFDHLVNGMAVSPDGKFLYINSGSRTDHGEVENNRGNFQNVREVPITSAILRVPTDAENLILPNDEATLKPYLFADGTRNSFDPEFAPNGDLFAGDNGPDADYPDELNWLREGKHYGFPWRFGQQDNPQQFPDYDSSKDKRLQQDFTAVQIGAYRTDPTFPKAPGAFTDPVANHGPAAAQYRADDGSAHDAAKEDKPLYSLTPHRSPLGLVFAADAKMPADLRGEGDALSAFLLSWGAAGGSLTDRGQDLLHLKLTKEGDNYSAVTTQIARGFKNPIDAVLIENRLYVLEFSGDSTIWELTFQ